MTQQEQTAKDLLIRLTETFGTPTTGRELASRLCLENTQQVRRLIHSLRLQGEPICSSNAGYWYARNDAELIDNSRQIERFAISVLIAARGMRSKLVNQIEFDGESNG